MQTLEAVVDRPWNGFGGHLGVAVADPVATAGPRNFGGQHKFAAARRIFCDPFADERFGTALRLTVRRHRIHLGGVDEVDPERQRALDLRVRLSGRVLLAPGHGAKADVGHFETAGAESSKFHAGVLEA